MLNLEPCPSTIRQGGGSLGALLVTPWVSKCLNIATNILGVIPLESEFVTNVGIHFNITLSNSAHVINIEDQFL